LQFADINLAELGNFLETGQTVGIQLEINRENQQSGVSVCTGQNYR
jgi:hypothetical protein